MSIWELLGKMFHYTLVACAFIFKGVVTVMSWAKKK